MSILRIVHIPPLSHRYDSMAEYEGFCLKCKTYGPIQDVKHFTMGNGRKRVGGTCSQAGCNGKISKIVG